MLKKNEFWILTTLAAIGLALAFANMVMFSQNRTAQAEVNGRAQYIQQAAQLEPLYREMVKALADLAVRNSDVELRDMLAKQGITVHSRRRSRRPQRRRPNRRKGGSDMAPGRRPARRRRPQRHPAAANSATARSCRCCCSSSRPSRGPRFSAISWSTRSRRSPPFTPIRPSSSRTPASCATRSTRSRAKPRSLPTRATPAPS